MSGSQDVGQSAEIQPDAEYERMSRAKVYTVAAAVAAALTVWYMFGNVFLAPVVGTIGAFCSWRGIRNDGNRRLLLILMVICLIPTLVAAVALILLLPNLPALSFSNVKIVKG